MMTIEQIQKEVYYYTGRYCSDEEAYEILAFAEGAKASLDEIISDYYNC
jgi:hypothetical protein